ncbi:hypothetical protein C5B42_03435 [Candidatus Cerribacteria bacterium 'Amazon FNV 2010 28 9']|uniref:Sortase n=1 Tax=Candidatus Cerribacteria bacterium 'Amazon FNV 2010 28 9' TaxID=2081795 RepID=A0A317JTP7_9BACT|nr:MAG: hypothetical protein C5B42_03435 [Candidatus Cerribacteria bacterium 'Amazon FNV 2010 28 9']
MSVQRYTKQYTRMTPVPLTIKERKFLGIKKKKHSSLVARVFPILLMGVGILFLMNAIWPILSYELFTSPSLRAAEAANVQPPLETVKEYLLPTPKPTPKVVADELDYTDLSNWFPQNSMPLLTTNQTKRYELTIPKVNITNADVAIGGTNLDRSLIQYPGTANPGELGSPVIFGHSVLRQFYDPVISNPRRYISIFSMIMTLQNGDDIYLDMDGVRYTYRVYSKTEVRPEDTFILEQDHSNRELKLVTCTPEGTTLRRGIVLAQLVQ